MKKYDAIIFDMDGTLWDSSDSVCKSWMEVIRSEYPQLREFTPKEMSAQMGKQMPDIGKGLYPELDDKDSFELVKRCCKHENEYLETHGGKLYPKLESTLKKLSEHYELAIVSNCQAGYIEAFFKAHGLEAYFKDIECYGNNGLTKAENIKMLVKRNGFTNAIYCGDTQIDCDSSRDAGIDFIWAAYGFGKTSSFTYKIDSFSELSEILC